MKKTKFSITRHGVPCLLLCAAQASVATELVYTPVNPNFGGSSLNGAALLSAAQAQNKHKDPDASVGDGKQTALEQFNESLQRSVLNRLAAAATSGILGPTGKLIPGAVETGDFLITIADMGGGVLKVVTTDKISGASTSFEVSN